MNSKISKYYDYISTGLLTLITFFCLAFSLIKGVGLGGSISENGFTYISFAGGVEDWLLYLTGIMCILQLGVCLFMTIYFVKILCTQEKESDKKLFFIFNIVFLSFLFIYMILGILFVALNGGYTLAYIPFLLGVLVFIFYFLQKKMNGETFKKAPAKAQAKKIEEKPAAVKAEEKPAAKPAAKK